MSNKSDDWRHSTSEDGGDCLFGKCKKCGPCQKLGIFGVFKSRFDCAICVFIFISLASLLLAVIGPLMLDVMINKVVDVEVVIDSPDAVNYEAWQSNAKPDSTIKVDYNIFFFDIQNPDGMLSGEIPVVTELGPYSFHEYYNKFDISWSDGGDTVTYNTQKFYVFNPQQTTPGLSISDQLTLPYPTLLGLEYLMSTIPEGTDVIVEEMLLNGLDMKYGYMESNLTALETAIRASLDNMRPINPKYSAYQKALYEVIGLENELTTFYDGLRAFILVSNPLDLLTKSLLCNLPQGVSPFFTIDPVQAYFGWFNDPLLTEVQLILNRINSTTPWSTAVPGAATNWTSIEDTRRRRPPDTFKTGKKNTKEVAQYVRYQNMSEIWTCINSMSYEQAPDYQEGSMFPCCYPFQNDWTDEEAEAHGYTQPFGSSYANRIKGSDANMIGRPVDTDKVQVFISDIYRSAFLIYEGDVNDWYDVKLRRYGLQAKDLWNSTLNPENAEYYSFGPSGLENLTKALNIPLFVSFPHFLEGDPALVSAVRGLKPNYDIHYSYLDIEPQSGLLARARKRLQLSYFMQSQTFPDMPLSWGTVADEICTNYTRVATLIDGLDNPTLPVLPLVNCKNGSEPRPLLECLATTVSWNLASPTGVYMPYAWAEESVTLSEDDADSLKNSLFLIESLAKTARFWFLIMTSVSVACVIMMLLTRDHLLPDEFQRPSLSKNYVTISNTDNAFLTAAQDPLIKASVDHHLEDELQ